MLFVHSENVALNQPPCSRSSSENPTDMQAYWLRSMRPCMFGSHIAKLHALRGILRNHPDEEPALKARDTTISTLLVSWKYFCAASRRLGLAFRAPHSRPRVAAPWSAEQSHCALFCWVLLPLHVRLITWYIICICVVYSEELSQVCLCLVIMLTVTLYDYSTCLYPMVQAYDRSLKFRGRGMYRVRFHECGEFRSCSRRWGTTGWASWTMIWV